jgi:hypothetical protein
VCACRPPAQAAEAALVATGATSTYDDSAHSDERLGPFAKPAAAAAAKPAGQQPPEPPPLPSGRSTASGSAPLLTVATDKQADVVADYLLNGWTMLGEACPLEGCHAPLMWQKKDRKKFCPAHQLWVLTGARDLCNAGRQHDFERL